MIERIKKFFLSFYQKFMSMHDTPQHIALGFGIGVFFGILPLTGVVPAIGLAWLFKLNKPAAILGTMVTNTWLSVLVFGISVQMGCGVLGMESDEISKKFWPLIKNFHWKNFSDPEIWRVVGAVSIGYLLISLIFAVLAYLGCLALLYFKKRS